MDDRTEPWVRNDPSVEAERIHARADATSSVATLRNFLGERGTLVDVHGLSDAEQELIRDTIIRYAIALRVLQESAESVMLKVRRLMEDGMTPEMAGARRRLVNEAVTWAMKAYFDSAKRQN